MTDTLQDLIAGNQVHQAGNSPVADVAASLLARDTVLTKCVKMIPGRRFTELPTAGQVTLAVPVRRDGRQQVTQGAEITFDAVDQLYTTLTLDHYYSGSVLSDEQWTMSLHDANIEVVAPMVGAVIERCENAIAKPMNDLTVGDDYDAATINNIDERILQARVDLTNIGCPLSDRFLVCSPEFAKIMLLQEKLSDASAYGDEGAIQGATIGMYRGARVIESPYITAGRAIYMHRGAFIGATVAPALPARGSQERSRGDFWYGSDPTGYYTMRIASQYMMNRLSNAMVVSTFCGAAVVEDRNHDKVDENDPDSVVVRAIAMELDPDPIPEEPVE